MAKKIKITLEELEKTNPRARQRIKNYIQHIMNNPDTLCGNMIGEHFISDGPCKHFVVLDYGFGLYSTREKTYRCYDFTNKQIVYPPAYIILDACAPLKLIHLLRV